MPRIQTVRSDARLERLRRIYAEIRIWGQDPQSAKRVLRAVDPSAKLLVVAEAAGPILTNLSSLVVQIHNAELPRYRFFHPSPASLAFTRWFASFSKSPERNRFIPVLRRYL